MENVHHGNAKLCGIMSARRTMCLSLAHLSGFSQLSMNRNAQRFKNLISEWKKDSSYSNSNSISPLFHQLCMILCVNLFSNFNKWTNLFFNVSTEVWQQPSLFSPDAFKSKISDFRFHCINLLFQMIWEALPHEFSKLETVMSRKQPQEHKNINHIHS